MFRTTHDRGEDMDAARRQILEAESGSLQQSAECIRSTQARRNRARSLVIHHCGNIDNLQAGLLCERFERVRERLRGDIGGQRRYFNGLGLCCLSLRKSDGCTDRRTRNSADTSVRVPIDRLRSGRLICFLCGCAACS